MDGVITFQELPASADAAYSHKIYNSSSYCPPPLPAFQSVTVTLNARCRMRNAELAGDVATERLPPMKMLFPTLDIKGRC